MRSFLLILLLWQGTISLVVSKNATEQETYAQKRQSKAEEMQKYMKPEIEPCENFYDYACGNWAKINPSQFVLKTGLFQVLADAYDVEARKILKELNVNSSNKIESKVKTFYNSCLNRTEIRESYKEKLSAIMEEFGGMPALKGDLWNAQNFDWLEVIAKILRKYGKQILIGVDVSTDMTNSSINRIHLGELKDTITSKVQWYYDSLQSKYQRELESIFHLSYKNAREIAKQMANFKKSVAEGISEPLDGVLFHNKAKLYTLEDLSAKYGPTLNLTRFVSVWLGYDYQQPVYEYVESYLRNLQKLIEKTPKSIVANFIMWELLEDFQFKPASSVEEQEQKCVELTKKHFTKYLDHLVYRQLMKLERNRNINAEMQQLFGELKQSFAKILQSNTSSWLDADTRQKALLKLEAMSLELTSYEDENFEQKYGTEALSAVGLIKNLIKIFQQRGRYLREKVNSPPKLDSEEQMNFTPAYAVELNKILIPVAFLQSSFLWDPSYPAALKYATAGFVIGHEIVHGFDDNLRQYDAKGNLANWWHPQSSEEFLRRKECLSIHYSGHKYGGVQMPKSNAQDENIADNVGIRIAYEAYKNWLSQQLPVDKEREQLPNLNLTPQKLFFLSLAQVWCTDVFAAVRSLIAQLDAHAPEEVRVLAMMSNYNEFSKEFQCKANAKMNPLEKCVVY